MLPDDLKDYRAEDDTFLAIITDVSAALGVGVAFYLVTVLLLSL